MDTVYNSLMAMGQAKPVQQSSGAKQEKNVQKNDEFQKLLQNQQNAQMKDQSAAAHEQKTESVPAEKAENNLAEQGGQSAQLPANDELENRMMLAAMAAAQMIVPMQDNAVAENEGTPAAAVNLLTMQPEQAARTVQTPQMAENQLLNDAAMQMTQNGQVQVNSTEQKAEMPQLQNMQNMVQTAENAEDNNKKDVVEIRNGYEAETPLFREVNAVPVQVGQADALEAKPAVPVAEQVLNTLETAVKEGQRFIELELEPHNLGKVRIEMLMQKDGTMQVLLRAEKPATQLMLDRDAAELQSALARSTRQDVQVETPHQQENAHLQYDEQQNRNGSQQQNNRQNEQSNHEESFLQQLRLGLVADDMLAS